MRSLDFSRKILRRESPAVDAVNCPSDLDYYSHATHVDNAELSSRLAPHYVVHMFHFLQGGVILCPQFFGLGSFRCQCC